MTESEFRCAWCGGLPVAGERFDCIECGRPLGTCAACGWCVRFFEAADPKDCDNGQVPRRV
jgi:hypothetical protein